MAHEFDGEKYRRASTHQEEWGRRLISELELNGAEAVLDLGCGDGRLTAVLADAVPDGRVLGIDASSGMISTALELPVEENLVFELLDISDIYFEDEFELVFSNAALHWVLDHKKLLENVYRALKSGGKVRFNFAGDGNCANYFKAVKEVIELDEFAPFFNDFEWPWYMPVISEYEVLASETGFTESKVWDENADRYFPDREAIVGWIEQPSIVPFLPYLPEEQKSDFRDAVVERVLELTDSGDGRYFETFRRVNLLAVK